MAELQQVLMVASRMRPSLQKQAVNEEFYGGVIKKAPAILNKLKGWMGKLRPGAKAVDTGLAESGNIMPGAPAAGPGISRGAKIAVGTAASTAGATAIGAKAYGDYKGRQLASPSQAPNAKDVADFVKGRPAPAAGPINSPADKGDKVPYGPSMWSNLTPGQQKLLAVLGVVTLAGGTAIGVNSLMNRKKKQAKPAVQEE